MIGPLRHPHSDSVSEAGVSPATNSQQPHGEIFELSMSTSQKSQSASPKVLGVPDPSNVTSDPAKAEPVNLPAGSDITISGAVNLKTSDPVTPDPKTIDPVTPDPITTVNPDPKTSDPSKGGQLLAKRSDPNKMSKKEKKFHLSKDDGRYAELNPISPHEAKMEFGETLRLNPVGPELGGVASSEEGNTSAVPGPESSE